MRPGSQARLRGTGLHRRLEAVTGMRPACAISQLSYSPARACAARHLQNYAKPRVPDAHWLDLFWTAVLRPALCTQQPQLPNCHALSCLTQTLSLNSSALPGTTRPFCRERECAAGRDAPVLPRQAQRAWAGLQPDLKSKIAICPAHAAAAHSATQHI